LREQIVIDELTDKAISAWIGGLWAHGSPCVFIVGFGSV
jgi:hypothetical protein